jgi:hypothetical protein
LPRDRDRCLFVYQQPGARQLVEAIHRNAPHETALQALLDSEDMQSPVGNESPLEAVLEAIQVLERWLSRVDGQHVGLLDVE